MLGSVEKRPLLICLAALALYLIASGFWLSWGMHDNDWPLLMWLSRAWSFDDLSPLFVGHYPPAQLLLVQLTPMNTLAAAKLLNVVATVGSAALVYATARQLAPRTSADRAWGLVALAIFALSAEALLSGQSEFADPLATCALLGGLYLVFSGRADWRAGVLIGVSGWFRLHFVVFGFGVACVMAIYSRRPSVVLGWFFASLPMMLANYLLHGTLFSPVAGTFLGQVLFGYDEHDFARTYARHPLGEVLREHWVLVVELVRTRLAECPKRLWPLVAIVTFGLWRREPKAQALWLCCAGYYLGVIALGWEVTTRLLLPLVALLALGCVASLAHGRFQHRAVLALLAFVVLRFAIARHPVPDELNRAVDAWDASEQLTAFLRDEGMKDPREAFVVDWRRVPTDTPDLSAFYNFGFWNLLAPRYAVERPIGKTVSHFKRNGVKWIVLSSKYAWTLDEPMRLCGARTTDAIYCIESP